VVRIDFKAELNHIILRTKVEIFKVVLQIYDALRIVCIKQFKPIEAGESFVIIDRVYIYV
jgi:hypothetical protein